MTDSNFQPIAEPEEDNLLLKLDKMLQRYQQDNLALVQKAPPPDTDADIAVKIIPEEQFSSSFLAETSDIPLLIEKVELTAHDWPAETKISELLCFAFDHAIRDAQIKLDPLARITLLQALAKRLPKNFQ